MAIRNIILLSQYGHLICSPKKETQIEMATAYHLEVLCRGFQWRIFYENLMKNIDEIHFTINMDNGYTLRFRGDTSLKFADVVAGGEGITMIA